MTDIKAIKIIGIDEQRPPRVRKESYIDLFFKLSEQAPVDWCEDFNKLGHQITPPAKITPDKGLIVETYVHDMNLIQNQLDKIKEQINRCTEAYLEKERQKQLALENKQVDTSAANSKQNRLNTIISELNYET